MCDKITLSMSAELTVRDGKDPDEIVAPLKEFDNAEKEVQYLRRLLLDMVEQNCNATNDKGYSIPHEYFSGYISTHAEAMRYLCSVNMLRMINDGYGRAVYCADLNS